MQSRSARSSANSRRTKCHRRGISLGKRSGRRIATKNGNFEYRAINGRRPIGNREDAGRAQARAIFFAAITTSRNSTRCGSHGIDPQGSRRTRCTGDRSRHLHGDPGTAGGRGSDRQVSGSVSTPEMPRKAAAFSRRPAARRSSVKRCSTKRSTIYSDPWHPELPGSQSAQGGIPAAEDHHGQEWRARESDLQPLLGEAKRTSSQHRAR